MPDSFEKAAPSFASASDGPTGAERRTDPRYKFVAAAEVTGETGIRVDGRIGDVGRRGCYVETANPFPLHSVVSVKIIKGSEAFEAKARVVFSSAGKGMGLLFTFVPPNQHHVLTGWLVASLETSWLTSNRRRSQRIMVELPVTVSGNNDLGEPFVEKAHTQAISAHGALVLLSAQVNKGQTLIITNAEPAGSTECQVAHIGEPLGKLLPIGLAFVLPNASFWHAHFPPIDWTRRHPDAK